MHLWKIITGFLPWVHQKFMFYIENGVSDGDSINHIAQLRGIHNDWLGHVCSQNLAESR